MTTKYSSVGIIYIKHLYCINGQYHNDNENQLNLGVVRDNKNPFQCLL